MKSRFLLKLFIILESHPVAGHLDKVAYSLGLDLPSY